jgi:hypothetical protein
VLSGLFSMMCCVYSLYLIYGLSHVTCFRTNVILHQLIGSMFNLKTQVEPHLY